MHKYVQIRSKHSGVRYVANAIRLQRKQSAKMLVNIAGKLITNMPGQKNGGPRPFSKGNFVFLYIIMYLYWEW